MNILEFLEKEKKPSESVLKILELMENIPIPDDPTDITGYGLKLKGFNNECCIIQADNSITSKFSNIYGLDMDVLNCELQKRYGIRLISMNTNQNGAELNFRIVPQSSFQPRRTGYFKPFTTDELPYPSSSLKISGSEFFEKNKNLNDPEVLKEAKKHFHKIFMDETKRQNGGIDPNPEKSEKTFEKLFNNLTGIVKEMSSEDGSEEHHAEGNENLNELVEDYVTREDS